KKGTNQSVERFIFDHFPLETSYRCFTFFFPPMGSVTVCTQLHFDSETFGLSTVFSYSIQSCANEFQLRAQVIRAFDHDDSWHPVCVSWSDGLNSTDSIGPDGLFIIGQEQETFGGSFKSESFSGSVTELHIWDRVLDSSEIFTMEKKCSPVSSGLVFKWSKAAMEIENSLTKLVTERPCQGTLIKMQLGNTERG
uniref:Pentraxin (PTX) domain-containing protein n=1 Tax=Oryzias latipes TaxID=8090 RepID=A0A3B3HG94_ORYLA